MSKEDYYKLLGLQKGAGDSEIKRAFRKKAKELHPDQNRDNPKAEEQFKAVNEAYEILKDPEKRAAYDQYGHAAFEGGMGGGGGHPGAGGFGGGDFGDIFDDLFGNFMGGGRSRQSSSSKGADLRYNMRITLEEAFNGKKSQITIPSTVDCTACDGTGSADKKPPQTCPTCNGRGSVRAQSGFFTIERTCPTCGGEGKIIKNKCRTCVGTGQMPKDKVIDVSIPAGVDDGSRIRITGEGQAGSKGGAKGDLYIFISISDHQIFEREDSSLYCQVPVTMVTAALGGKIDVPTIDGGKARVNIPAGTQSGKQLRLSGKGMPILRSSRVGDMYIEIFVETPVKLSKKQKKLLQDFDDENQNNYAKCDGFFKKAKDIFGW